SGEGPWRGRDAYHAPIGPAERADLRGQPLPGDGAAGRGPVELVRRADGRGAPGEGAVRGGRGGRAHLGVQGSVAHDHGRGAMDRGRAARAGGARRGVGAHPGAAATATPRRRERGAEALLPAVAPSRVERSEFLPRARYRGKVVPLL